MGPEAKVKSAIKKLLKSYDVYYHMPVQNGMGAPSLDFICCVRGYYLAIEAKAPGKVPTPRQKITMSKIRSACGYAICVATEHDLAALESWLKHVTQ